MGVIKAAIGDAILTFMWVFLSSTMDAMLALIATALGLETLVWPSVLITTSIVFVLALKLDLIVSSDVLKSIGWIFIDKGMISVIKKS